MTPLGAEVLELSRAIRFIALLLVALAGCLAGAVQPALAGADPEAGPIRATVLGAACLRPGGAKSVVEDEALAAARQKGREYAASEIETRTTLESGVASLELMGAYAEGVVHEITPPEGKWIKDPHQGECYEVQVQLEVTPNLNRTHLRPVRNNIAKGLFVDSEPPGAEIFVDRRYKGVTPMVVQKVEPGKHELEVGRIPGYQEFKGEIEVIAGKPWKNVVVLGKKEMVQPDPAPVTALGPAQLPEPVQEPAAASSLAPSPKTGETAASEDKTAEGKTSSDQPDAAPSTQPSAGQSAGVSVEPSRDRRQDEAVTPPAFETPEWVTVRVITEPVSSKIYLDDKFIGETPAEFLARAGAHQIRLIPLLASMYKSIEKEISVSHGKLNALFLRFESK